MYINSMKKINLYTYCSAKEYLHNLFLANKEEKKMTIKKFSQQLGFNSHSFFIDIFNGKKFLSKDSVLKISENLKLKVREQKYLTLASEYDKEESPKAKQEILEKLLELRLKVTSTPMTVNQIDYYMNWFNPIVRELCVKSNWNGDYKKLAKMVIPEIKEKEAIHSVELLVDLGLVVKEGDKYINTSEIVYATQDLRTAAIYWIKEMIGKGQNAIDKFTKDERYITTTSASLSKEKYTQVQEHFDKINALLFEEDNSEDKQVYQIGLQMFPVSKKLNGE